MAVVYTQSNISVNPDSILAEEIYTGVVIQGEPIKDFDESDENHLNFRNRNAEVDELVETTITGQITIHHSGDDDLVAKFNPEATLLVTDFKTLTEKKAKDIQIGDNLVDGNFYQEFMANNEDARPVFVQLVEYDTTTQFPAHQIKLRDDVYSWYGIFVDDMFVKYEK